LFDWGWDSHEGHEYSRRPRAKKLNVQSIDRPCPPLLLDLKSNGGLLGETGWWYGEAEFRPELAMQENREKDRKWHIKV